jgi:transposase-like protein
MTTTKPPETLLEAVVYFADPAVALAFVANLRWPSGAVCPDCEEAKEIAFLATRQLWKCRKCKRQFSAKVGTIFEDSPIPLSKWLPAMWLIANCKNGVSSYEIGRGLKVTQKTAWFMLHRIRLAMQSEGFKLSGTVEVDESFIGGKSRNMHALVRKYRIQGTGGMGKASVLGMLERPKGGHSRIRTKVVEDRKKKTLQDEVRAHVEPGSEVHTDALASYNGLEAEYAHKVVDHAREYVRGNVHTNGIENFWSLLKRGIRGTYVSVEPFHLFRYLDEQAFRFNNRGASDSERFLQVAASIIGKRLTYKALLGQAGLAT